MTDRHKFFLTAIFRLDRLFHTNPILRVSFVPPSLVQETIRQRKFCPLETEPQNLLALVTVLPHNGPFFRPPPQKKKLCMA
jgi:hypothetical protein